MPISSIGRKLHRSRPLFFESGNHPKPRPTTRWSTLTERGQTTPPHRAIQYGGYIHLKTIPTRVASGLIDERGHNMGGPFDVEHRSCRPEAEFCTNLRAGRKRKARRRSVEAMSGIAKRLGRPTRNRSIPNPGFTSPPNFAPRGQEHAASIVGRRRRRPALPWTVLRPPRRFTGQHADYAVYLPNRRTDPPSPATAGSARLAPVNRPAVAFAEPPVVPAAFALLPAYMV